MMVTNTVNRDKAHSISWQVKPVKDKFISPIAMMIYTLILIVGPILCIRSLQWPRWSFSAGVFMGSAVAMFFSILMFVRFINFHSKYKHTRSYRVDQKGITISYADCHEKYDWDQVAGWIGLQEEAISFYKATRKESVIAELGERHILPEEGIVIRLSNGNSINLEVPGEKMEELVEALNVYTIHITP